VRLWPLLVDLSGDSPRSVSRSGCCGLGLSLFVSSRACWCCRLCVRDSIVALVGLHYCVFISSVFSIADDREAGGSFGSSMLASLGTIAPHRALYFRTIVVGLRCLHGISLANMGFQKRTATGLFRKTKVVGLIMLYYEPCTVVSWTLIGLEWRNCGHRSFLTIMYPYGPPCCLSK